MINMTVSEMEKKDDAEYSIVEDRPMYPYGLSIRLDARTVKKLGIRNAPQLSEKMLLKAIVEVTEVRAEIGNDDTRGICLELQITDMELNRKQDKSAEQSIYGG